jgi:hypothetical protein
MLYNSLQIDYCGACYSVYGAGMNMHCKKRRPKFPKTQRYLTPAAAQPKKSGTAEKKRRLTNFLFCGILLSAPNA